MDWGVDSNYFRFAFFAGTLFTFLNTWWFYMLVNALIGKDGSAKINVSHHDVKNE
jgi:hypothetical protein